MRKHNIPTARYQNFNELEATNDYVRTIDCPIVIKASGPAVGKGVILPSSTKDALQALEDILVKRKFGDAGSSVVIEEYGDRQEISILTLSDCYTTWSFPPGQDHKRIYDGDRCLTLGGMGDYAPAPFVTPSIMEEIEKTILKPTFEGIRE